MGTLPLCLITKTLGPVGTNCYLVLDKQMKTAFLVDAPLGASALLDDVKDYMLTAVLLTHAHWDHFAGLRAVMEMRDSPLGQPLVYMHGAECSWLHNPVLNRSAQWPKLFPGGLVYDGEVRVAQHDNTLQLGDFRIKVLHIPGHTPGGLAYLVGDHVFTGDTLLCGKLGRTNLPGANLEVLRRNMGTHLLALPGETKVYPGHGPTTTIGNERGLNGWLPFGTK